MDYFPNITNNNSVSEREENILSLWRELKVFELSLEQTKSGEPFTFYEGPPTANGKPGMHHILSRVYKDIYIRFYTQQGYAVPRKAGWDCHGLPVEREVEKNLGIKTKHEIEASYGIARFNELCRESVLRYISEWNKFSERMAFFVDLDKPYFTMDNDYIETVWSLLKKIDTKGLIYQSNKVVPYDPVLGSTMSDAEVDLGYKEVDDLSLTLRFELLSDNPFGEKTFILVWTTTPWTLPANVALAVAPDEQYVLLIETNGLEKSKLKNEKLICAYDRISVVFGDDWQEQYKIADTFPGSLLLKLKYNRLFDFIDLSQKDKVKRAWYILGADFVRTDSGTGIVHLAPAYGADDLNVAKKYELPLLHGVGLNGKFLESSPYGGLHFKDADKEINRDLKKRGLVWKIEKYRHKYPFGYRTGSPLLYYAKDAWYIRTTAIKDQLIANNHKINWFPSHIKEGRFGKWLENNQDWALSRERYWGTPLPIWTDNKGNYRLVASRHELSELSGKDCSSLDLHRPAVDEIEFNDPESGNRMKRVPEVLDCWFDSGAMPYAQWSAKEKEENLFSNFPADFISEAIDQTRGWFYTLLCISSMVSESTSYKNAICLGHVLDEKGEKMSKSKGNVVDPWEVFKTHGADAIRWYFLTKSAPGNSRRITKANLKNDPVSLVHSFFNMFRSSVSFFILYANVDNIKIQEDNDDDWENNPIAKAPPFKERPMMDRWLLSKSQDLIKNVTSSLKAYDCLAAGKAIEEFLDGLSNWYIRRNRRRFWKGELDQDKLSAYDSLYRSLVSLCRLISPFVPFLAEEAFQSLVSIPLACKQKKSAKHTLSVILAGWPKPDHQNYYDHDILAEGEILKELVYLGRSARQLAKIKIRQPLKGVFLYLSSPQDRTIISKNRDVLLDELNIKDIEFLDDSAEILDYRIKANLPRIGKKFGRYISTIQKYLKTNDSKTVIKELEVKGKLLISLDDLESKNKVIELEKDDLLIESISKEGSVAVEGLVDSKGIVLSLNTTLNPELISEGIARDLVRHIQELRKNSGLELTDRIGIYVSKPSLGIIASLNSFKDYIAKETLAKFYDSSSLETENKIKISIEKESVEIMIWKLSLS